MAQIHVDPDALDAFASRLEQFRHAVREEQQRLEHALHRLGDTWRDADHDHFTDQFRAVSLGLDEFWEQVDRAIPTLRRDAENIRRILSIQLPR